MKLVFSLRPAAGAKIVLLGVNSEKVLAEKIISFAKNKNEIIDLDRSKIVKSN